MFFPFFSPILQILGIWYNYWTIQEIVCDLQLLINSYFCPEYQNLQCANKLRLFCEQWQILEIRPPMAGEIETAGKKLLSP